MYKLYFSPGTASFAVHWMLIEIGVAFELERVDLGARQQLHPAFLRLNAKGQVPVLLIDGRPYTESAALLMILAERHPEAALAPLPGVPERAAYIEAMMYLTNALLPAFRTLFYVQDFAGPEQQANVLAHAQSRIGAVFSQLDSRLADGRPYLIGESISAVDFLAVMLARWSRRMPSPAQAWPMLAKYLARIKRRPSLQEVHRREGLTDWIYDNLETV